VLSGDTLFVGDIARPDLAVEKREGASGIFHSLSDTLIAIVVAIIAGGLLLVPSLILLFRLILGGQLGHAEDQGERPRRDPAVLAAARSGIHARLAGSLVLCGVGLLTVVEGGWAHALGVISLLAFVIVGFWRLPPAQIAAQDPGETRRADPGRAA
jgi:cytochrome d ubiquinol oxidase subunit II